MVGTRRNETAGNGMGLNGAPWWVKFAYAFGVPAAIAGFLIYFLAGHLDAEIHRILEHENEQRFYLRGICLNTAENEGERANCREHQR